MPAGFDTEGTFNRAAKPGNGKTAAMQTNATRQYHYRVRQLGAGAKRLDVFISPAAHQAIARKATADGVTQREVIERLALSVVETQTKPKD